MGRVVPTAPAGPGELLPPSGVEEKKKEKKTKTFVLRVFRKNWRRATLIRAEDNADFREGTHSSLEPRAMSLTVSFRSHPCVDPHRQDHHA
jgi:hypothetical protein